MTTTEAHRQDTFRDAAALAGVPVLIIGALLAATVIAGWVAFVLHKLYMWFVVPLGAPVLNWWHIWGLWLVYNLVTFKIEDRAGKPKDPHPGATMVGNMAGRVTGAALVLLVGWFVHRQAA